MISRIKEITYNSEDFNIIKEELGRKREVRLKGVAGSLKALLASYLFEKEGGQILYLALDDEEAEGIGGDLEALLGEDRVKFFLSGEFSPFEGWSLKPEILTQRIKTLEALLTQEHLIVVSSVAALGRRIVPPEPLKAKRLDLHVGGVYDFEGLITHLVDLGYSREDLVGEPGEISVRGGIVDVFPLEKTYPLRIEFFGDRIESIREFDVVTQRSRREVERVVLMPPKIDLSSEERNCSLLHYLKPNALIFQDDPDLLAERVDQALSRTYGMRRRFQMEEEDPLSVRESFFSAGELEAQMGAFKKLSFYSLHPPAPEVLDLGSREQESFGGNVRLLRQRIRQLSEKGTQVFVLCDDHAQAERLEEVLDTPEEPLESCWVGTGALRWGFHYPKAELSVFTEREVYGRSRRRRIRPRPKGGIPLRHLSALNIGDYVVHVDFGIGKYLGLEKITVRGNERECLKILYQDGDKLYVPIEKLHRIQKYSGEEGVVPQLSKLGSKDWEKLKARTKRSIKNIARDLIEIYAARKALKGHAFSPDTPWQKELEASFVYDETPDQLQAIIDVKRDMERPVPMDRLICGDVGFGKTEVALRASFKAVMDGKQVALLAPTTVLAQQHYNTFRERLRDYPVNVAMLSRFKTPREQKRIIQELREGKIDIVIGTHRLISDDIGFKDLGLLIIDDEQRFGVRHKEKLKKLKKLVDVLTLTATPIPRTLHMSLMGAKDMSTINTPPQNRLPIITEVIPFDKELIRRAILQEVERGGQVYFVHNRVQSIDAVLQMLRRLLPEVGFAVAHGQMSERELERVMLEFMDRWYDCLVCTAIIEAGLDIPNVNTILINRADRFGLAQLYQLRGRVGRSNRQAYAYLIVPPLQYLTEKAVKRLRTIEEVRELGSGFQIALRDLHIRGAGNLLGPEQSGFINAVGFDLYCKILDEAVRELKGVSEEKPIETQVDVNMDAFLPEEYVSLASERVEFYKRLAEVESPAQIKEMEEELRDRFGPIPQPARNLLNIASLRVLGSKLGLEKIEISGSRMIARLSPRIYDRDDSKELLGKVVKKAPYPFHFYQDEGFGFVAELNGGGEEGLNRAKEFLGELV